MRVKRCVLCEGEEVCGVCEGEEVCGVCEGEEVCGVCEEEMVCYYYYTLPSLSLLSSLLSIFFLSLISIPPFLSPASIPLSYPSLSILPVFTLPLTIGWDKVMRGINDALDTGLGTVKVSRMTSYIS